MRPFKFFAISIAVVSSVPLAHAQNYVPAQDYNSPSVIVNLDVVGANGSRPGAPMMRPPAAVLSQPLRAPMPPVVLRPPMPQAPQIAAPSMMPPRMAMQQPPAMPPAMPAPMPNFAASDLARRAPPIPSHEMIAPSEEKPLAQKPVGSSPSRELLAAARAEANSPTNSAPREQMLLDDVPAKAPAPVATAPIIEKPVEEEFAPPSLPVAPSFPLKPAENAAAEPMVVASAAPTAPVAEEAAKTVVDDFEAYRLLFSDNETTLKPSEQAVVDKLVGKMKADQAIRLQIRSYAAGTPDTESQARRLSLTRALAVRSALVQAGILATRLDVRALGTGSKMMGDQATRRDIPPDRVDMIVTR